MTDETTAEQLAEIDRDMADIERQVAELVEEAQKADYKTQELETKTQELPEYTPPEGWRVVRFGELLQPGDMWVNEDGTEQRSAILHWDAAAVSGGRCIRRIKPQPQPEQKPQAETEAQPETQPQPIQVREGLWRQADGGAVAVRPTIDSPSNSWKRDRGYVWSDGGRLYLDNGRHSEHKTTEYDLVEYLGPIQRQSEPQPVPIQVREGRWKTRGGEVKNIRACEPLKGAYYVWPWTDGFMTFQDNGLHQGSRESPNDLVEYLGPIEPEPEPVPVVQGGLVRDVTHLLEESGVLDSAKAEQQIEELRSEVSYVQRLLGESRQRVTHLEELVTSLRNINEAQEKAFTAAGKENTALRNQLAAVASVAADRQRLQIELDAAQQVPADSPELRQLRADLEQMTQDRDTYHAGFNRLLSDLETIRETTKAAAVEAIAEWLQPIRAVDNPNLANETLQHLPQIMRHLTGLDSHAID